MQIDFDIKLEHIQIGTPGNAYCCALAKCLCGLDGPLRGAAVKVTKTEVQLFTAQGVRKAFPSLKLQKFIERFDRKEPVEPISSSLYFFEPEKSQRRRV